MVGLAVNVDHVATLRQARGETYPEPVAAAAIVELAGADGVVVHLRGDRRHINDRDVRIIREIVKTKMILEMAATEELIDFARTIKPHQVTLVPERQQEITTEGGLDVPGNRDLVGRIRLRTERGRDFGKSLHRPRGAPGTGRKGSGAPISWSSIQAPSARQRIPFITGKSWSGFETPPCLPMISA